MSLAYFSVMDYLIFGLSLGMSVLTGVYFAVKDRGAKSVDVYFHGNRNMPTFPVAMSLAVSCVSALSILGYPIEFYLYGAVWFWVVIAVAFTVVTTSVYFVPVYYDLQIKCVYEYLEYRFNRTLRMIASLFGILFIIIYMAVAIYYPALSLTTVTPISVEWAIFLTVAFCTLYTVIGGFKSVVWTDTLQSVIMTGGCIAFFTVLVSEVGGLNAMYQANVRGNRTNFIDLDLDPFKRSTSFGIFSLGYFSWLELMIGNQCYVQRYISCKSTSAARKSLLISMFPIMFIQGFCFLIGMALYAYYANCDPVLNGEVSNKDEILVYTLAVTTKMLPGLNGLFVSCVYSGTLSTVSTGINSLTVMVMEDFIALKTPIKSESKKLICSKVCGVITGVVILGFTYAISVLNGTIIEIVMSTLSCFGSSVTGVLILGVFFPWTNSIGAIVAAVAGFALNTYMTLGYLFTYHPSQVLPVSVDGCNSTITSNFTSQVVVEKEEYGLFDVSFTHTRFITIALMIPVGILASFVTGANDPKKMNPMLFAPLIDNKLLPEKFRKFMRFGVPEKRNKTDLKIELEKSNHKPADQKALM